MLLLQIKKTNLSSLCASDSDSVQLINVPKIELRQQDDHDHRIISWGSSFEQGRP